MSTSDTRGTLYDARGRWRRWEPEPLAEEPAPGADGASTAGEDDSAKEAEAPDPVAMQEELDRLRAAAHQQGYAEGYAAGEARGREAGWQKGHEEGVLAGLAAGREEGYTEGRAAAEAEVEALKAITESVTDALEKLEIETGQALVSLAVSIARQVLRSTLKAEPERILETVKEILQVEGIQQGLLRLRLNPADIDMVEQYLQRDGTVTRWRLQPDMSIERGGCIAETALGQIDATLQTRWRRVVTILGLDPNA